MQVSAADIYQDWLDATGEIIMSGDMSDLPRHVALPYLHKSPDMRVLIETPEDLRQGHESYATALRANGVKELVRLVAHAEFLGENHIQGYHTIYPLRNGKLSLPRFKSRIVLQRHGTDWKQAEVETVLRHSDWPISLLRVDEDRALPRGPNEPDARSGPVEPLAIYQSFLDRLSQANMANDVKSYAALCHLPLTSHTRVDDTVFETEESLGAVVACIHEYMVENGIDEFRRDAEDATFLSATQLCGYHVARFFSKGEERLEPIRSRMILERKGRDWRVRSVTNSIRNANFPKTKPVAVSDLITHREIQKRTKQWPNSL
ncbi:hypothetical protein E4Z66_09215 [Aliishimia ponticola]|uniref:Uncharacterized protein n=1 Tax=Aliishimia ponticola TaxID=2499833 RepID=A0A4S4NCF7_9RHOB|nr:hypothetical protein [Aliishimia ponticola]THH37102.1 hypothetical protein E4Z66_09215 [Aliishimia ponticola]